MKKIVFIFFVLLSFRVNAQITITQDDIASIGTIIYQAVDTAPDSTIILGSSGIDQVWDFSGLKNQEKDTINFVDPATTNFASDFSTSNLALVNISDNDTSSIAYFTTSLTDLVVNGFAIAPINIDTISPIVFNDPETFITFPSYYQSSFNDTSKYNFTTYYDTTLYGYQVDSVRSKRFTTKESVIDAWGTLTTPLGTFPVIRQYTKSIFEDDLWVHVNMLPVGWMWKLANENKDTSYTYYWWANNVGLPLIEMTYDNDSNMVKKVSWLQVSPSAVNQYQSNSNINIYPNPANKFLYIDNFNNTKIENIITIYNVLGEKTKVLCIKNEQRIKISLKGLKDGIYILTVISKDGKNIINKKLLIRH
jgi:hypothetical protein